MPPGLISPEKGLGDFFQTIDVRKQDPTPSSFTEKCAVAQEDGAFGNESDFRQDFLLSPGLAA